MYKETNLNSYYTVLCIRYTYVVGSTRVALYARPEPIFPLIPGLSPPSSVIRNPPKTQLTAFATRTVCFHAPFFSLLSAV